MLQVEEAQERVLAEVVPGPVESVPLSEACGRVLREEIAARADAPAADNSAMDGYAVRSEDVRSAPVTLPVRGEVPAGHPADAALEPHTAMRIMTGAFVPDGADAVVQVEWTDGGTEQVTIAREVRRGANIRRRGEDMRAGDVVLQDGLRLGPADIAILAAAGRTGASVGRRPDVAILSTGDELIEAGSPPVPGKIVNTNTHLLAALVREAGGVPLELGIVRDTREATIAAFESALAARFIISSGGVSVGAYDFVKEALEALGAETKFWRVAMKPGKPVVVSRLRDRVVFGLPGNPASCFVSFHLFVAPALRRYAGQRDGLFPPQVLAQAELPMRGAPDRRVYARVRVEARNGGLFAGPLVTQSSGALTSMRGANGLAVIEQDVRAGSMVPVLMLGPIAG